MDAADFDRKDVRRPMNAFLIFCKRHRSIVRERNPNLDNRSVTRILGDLWANLGEEDKSQYTDLAKQYKDAFMKANPDYKWHNPERVVPPTTNKPNTRPTNVRVLKSEHDMMLEGSITPGKLADPSNMGGLSMLLDPVKYPVMSGNIKIEDKHFLEADSSSSDTMTRNRATSDYIPEEDEDYQMNDLDHFDTEIENTESGSNAMELDDRCELAKKNETSREQTRVKTEQNDEKENDVNGNHYSSNDDNSNYDNHDPISECGQRVMDHILERIYTIEKQTGQEERLIKKEPTDRCMDEVDGLSKKSGDKLNTEKEEYIQADKIIKSEVKEKMIVKLPLTPQKSDQQKFQNFSIKKRKRCYSEGNMDTYESTEPISKKGKSSFNEVCDVGSQNETGNQSEDVTDAGDQSEVMTHDADKQDHDALDDESHPIRKSKRRNRGQRYQELINEGIIQPSRERLATMKGDAAIKEESTHEESVEKKDEVELAQDVLSVYPRQIRKRAQSESEKAKPPIEDGKRYKTGDFDLEAHIATLPACSLEKVAKNFKRSIIKVRSHSDSSKKSDSDKSDVILALPVPPHLKIKNIDDSGPPPTGSQKRKARKHSVTRLIPVSSSAGISLVAVKNETEAEEMIKVVSENGDEKQTIAERFLSFEKAGIAYKLPTSSGDISCDCIPDDDDRRRMNDGGNKHISWQGSEKSGNSIEDKSLDPDFSCVEEKLENNCPDKCDPSEKLKCRNEVFANESDEYMCKKKNSKKHNSEESKTSDDDSGSGEVIDMVLPTNRNTDSAKTVKNLQKDCLNKSNASEMKRESCGILEEGDSQLPVCLRVTKNNELVTHSDNQVSSSLDKADFCEKEFETSKTYVNSIFCPVVSSSSDNDANMCDNAVKSDITAENSSDEITRQKMSSPLSDSAVHYDICRSDPANTVSTNQISLSVSCDSSVAGSESLLSSTVGHLQSTAEQLMPQSVNASSRAVTVKTS